MIVDSHHHLWDPAEADYPWLTGEFEPIRRRFDPSDLAPLLRRHGVAGTIVVQARASIDETRALLATAERTPFMLGVVGWVDLASADLAADIAALREAPGGRLLVGVRHQVHDEPDAAWLLRPEVQRGIARVGGEGLAFDLLVRAREMPAAIELVRRHPDVRFVLDHVGKPALREGASERWHALIGALAEHENVACKLSGIVTEADWRGWRAADLQPDLRYALERFGPERSLFGSDWPVCLLAASYGEVLGIVRAAIDELDATGRSAVLGRTAVRVYRLDPDALRCPGRDEAEGRDAR
jgi:L-fuconolactonase